MAKCLAKAQMEAELDNALKQLELETRKCINRRLKKSGNDKKIVSLELSGIGSSISKLEPFPGTRRP